MPDAAPEVLVARALAADRWRQAWNAASPAGRGWARHFVAGGARSPQPSHEESEGLLLASMVPFGARLDAAPAERPTGPVRPADDGDEGEWLADDVPLESQRR